MRLHRLAQALAGSALASLGVSYALGLSQGNIGLFFQLGDSDDALLLGLARLCLSSAASALAIAAVTVLLIACAQAHRWIRFWFFLGCSVVLFLWATVLPYAIGLILSRTVSANGAIIDFQMIIALVYGAEFFLILAPLVFSVGRWNMADGGMMTTDSAFGESDAEFHIEPLAPNE